jgi:hypothetical protein
MGEAFERKEHGTFDGGPPTCDRIALEIHIFEPWLDDLKSDKFHIRIATQELYQRSHQRPPILCSACDYEFGFAECPALAFSSRPAFPKAAEYKIVCGAICGHCAQMPRPRLTQQLFHHLRLLWPEAEMSALQ